MFKIISGTDYRDSQCLLPPYSEDFRKVIIIIHTLTLLLMSLLLTLFVSFKVDVSKLRVGYFFEVSEMPVTPCTKAAIQKAVDFFKKVIITLTIICILLIYYYDY